jgi:hypothetical protein
MEAEIKHQIRPAEILVQGRFDHNYNLIDQVKDTAYPVSTANDRNTS